METHSYGDADVTEAHRIATLLSEGTDLTAASMLIGLLEDPDMEIPEEDRHVLNELGALSLVDGQSLTHLGRSVVVVLRRKLEG